MNSVNSEHEAGARLARAAREIVQTGRDKLERSKGRLARHRHQWRRYRVSYVYSGCGVLVLRLALRTKQLHARWFCMARPARALVYSIPELDHHWQLSRALGGVALPRPPIQVLRFPYQVSGEEYIVRLCAGCPWAGSWPASWGALRWSTWSPGSGSPARAAMRTWDAVRGGTVLLRSPFLGFLSAVLSSAGSWACELVYMFMFTV